MNPNEPHELAEVRLINEGADAARRLGEAALAALAAVRLLQDTVVTLMLRQAALDYFERASTGDLSPRRFSVREHLAMTIIGRLGPLLAPYLADAEPEDAAFAEEALAELGAEHPSDPVL